MVTKAAGWLWLALILLKPIIIFYGIMCRHALRGLSECAIKIKQVAIHWTGNIPVLKVWIDPMTG